MPGTGAGGWLGIAHEVTPGTWVTPLKFVPINSSSISWVQDTIYRRPIRQSADMVGAVQGNGRVEGDIAGEAFGHIVSLMLYCARTNQAKSGTTPNFTYTFTGSAVAIPARTMSVTQSLNNIIMAYTGCVVGSFNFSIEDGLLMFNPTILGRDEAVQAGPFTPTWGSTVEDTPYGAGSYQIQIPTSSQVFDTDNFTFSVDDSPEAQYRLKDTGRGAQFIAYGERTTSMTVDRDFENRTDFDAFKNLTASSVTLTATKGANNSISITMPASIKDTYEVGLSGQGDLIRASVAYNGVLDATGNAYTIEVKTQQDIT
jgi:hypothetical protein